MLDLAAENKSPNTISQYSLGVRLSLNWCANNGYAAVIDRRLVQTFIAELLANGASPSTAGPRIQGLRSLVAGRPVRV